MSTKFDRGAGELVLVGSGTTSCGGGFAGAVSKDDVRMRRGLEAGLQTLVNNFGLDEVTVVLWASPVGYVRRRVGAGGSRSAGQVSLASVSYTHLTLPTNREV